MERHSPNNLNESAWNEKEFSWNGQEIELKIKIESTEDYDYLDKLLLDVPSWKRRMNPGGNELT